MWIFLNNAFVSAVEHLDDPTLLVVRARVEGDLERFFPDAVQLKVERHEDRDYLFRTIVTKEYFASQIAKHAISIDYDNFKDSIPKGDTERSWAYNRVWSAMNDLQDVIHGVGLYVGSRFSSLGFSSRRDG